MVARNGRVTAYYTSFSVNTVTSVCSLLPSLLITSNSLTFARLHEQAFLSLQASGGGGGASGGGSLPSSLQLRLQQLEQAVQQLQGTDDAAATQQPGQPSSLTARVGAPLMC